MKKLLFITLFFTVVSVFGNSIHVAVGGNDNNDGTSWQTAVASIQKAIQLSKAGQEIRIATGTYKVADLRVPRDTKMVGGFNVKAYKTKEKTTIFEPTGKDILILKSVSNNCRFENITFQKQNITKGVNYSPLTAKEGSIFYNCKFFDFYNKTWSAIGYMHKGHVTFEKCEFARNISKGGSACFSFSGKSGGDFIDCVFYSNHSHWYSGVFNFASRGGLIKNCIFVGNKAPTAAVIRISTKKDKDKNEKVCLNIVNCTFAGNIGRNSVLYCEDNGTDLGAKINMVNSLFAMQPVRSKLIPKDLLQKNKDVESPFNIEGSSELKITNSVILYKGKLPFMDRFDDGCLKVVGSMGKFDYIKGFDMPVIFPERVAKLNIGAGQDKMPQGVEFPKTDILDNPRPENNCIVGAVQKLSVNKK